MKKLRSVLLESLVMMTNHVRHVDHDRDKLELVIDIMLVNL